MRLLVLFAVTLIFAAACAPAVSRESMVLVDPEVTFEELVQAPDRHVGRYLLLGGSVASVRTRDDDGSELEVVQHPVDRRGRIASADRSAGRFILRDDAFRDPSVYRPGRLVTVVGRVEGSRTGRIGERDYLYPVLTVHELRLWSPSEHPDIPRTRFGIGVGVGISR